MSDKIKTLWLNATKGGNLERVKCLLNQFPMMINETENYTYNFIPEHLKIGERAMLIAVISGHLDIVKYLTEEVIGINKEPGSLLIKYGFRPIQIAAKEGYLDIMKYLMEKVTGINKEPKDLLGRTPIHHAARYGNEEILKYLMEEATGIEKEPKDIFGERPIHLAATPFPLPSMDIHLDIVKYLMKRITEKEPKNILGETPLDLAKKRGHKEVVKFLETYHHKD